MIVVDASAVVGALVDDPVDPRLLDAVAEGEMHAPCLLDYEVASALRGHALAGKLSGDRLDCAISTFLDLRIERYPLASMMASVVALRDNFTSYDAAYVVLAELLEAPLVTVDQKMADARRLGIDVHVIGPGRVRAE